MLGVSAALGQLLACTEAALSDAGLPVCVTAATVGNPAIASCCECDSGGEGELWGNLLRIFRGGIASGADVSPRSPCAPVTWYAQYQLTLARCFPVIDEHGDLPCPRERWNAASQVQDAAAAIVRGVHCCAGGEPFILEGLTVQSDPLGGCSTLLATVRTRVNVGQSANATPMVV